MNSNPLYLWRSIITIAGAILWFANISFAQVLAPDAATLAKYDRNKNGRLDPEEIAARDAAEARKIPVETAAASEEPIVISPFEVRSEGRGYYSSNTMSGTRLNSKVEDLASSVTVVTKEQMSDFALLDVNDVFLYEAGTEGSGTFTDFSVDRSGSPVDNTQLNPNRANRVRGVGSANVSFGNFETSGRVPIDPINVDAVEISRGPNSTVFGLGNAAGTVNMQPASAHLTKDRSQLGFRIDSFDGYRSSLDVNRVLKRGVLGARGSAVYQHDGFVRKPSGADSQRLNGMIKYQPFKYTTLTASYSYYHIEGNRPNTTMPRDAVTGWRKAGSPTWDPVTASAKLNGVRVPGTFTATALPAYFSNANFRTLSTLFIDEKGLGYWGPSRTTSSTTTPNNPNQNVTLVNTVPEPIRAAQPLFSSDPTVPGKDLYDWSSINLAAVNEQDETTRTTYLQLEQIIFDTPRHMLAVQAGYFLEDSRRFTRNIMGTAGSSGATGFLHVDVNERMVDGSPNPYFLRPFIGIFGIKGTVNSPLRRETSRLQLAYKLDLRGEKNLLHWLGMHQFSGYGEYKDVIQRRIAYRDTILSGHSWVQPTQVAGAIPGFSMPAISDGYFRYYVGDNVGQNADRAPTKFNPGRYNYRWGNGVTGEFVNELALLGSAVVANDSGGTGNTRNVLKTEGVVLQSHLVGGRIVTTFGLRKDRSSNKRGALPKFLTGPNGPEIDYGSLNDWSSDDWILNEGVTKTAGIVVKPLPWLSVHGNKSDSFQPASYAINLQLQQVPDPQGKGKDYGFSLNLFGGKLVARVNRYETTQINSRDSSARTLAQRVRALDFDAAQYRVSLPFLLITKAQGWATAEAAARGVTLTPAQLDARVSEICGLAQRYLVMNASFPGPAHFNTAETGDVVARGTEIELNFNPTIFWTAKLNATQQESIDSRLSPGVTNWINERMPFWQRIIDPDIGRPWFTERYGGAQSASEYLAAQVTSQVKIATATEGKSRPQVRRYRANLSTSYRLAGLTDQALVKRFSVGGALRWEAKSAIGYYGVEQLPAIITELDPNRPIYDKAHLSADAFVGYRTRLWKNKVAATFQLNVRNLQEGGRLQAISAYPDGTPNAYRIVDPRQFIFSATFDL